MRGSRRRFPCDGAIIAIQLYDVTCTRNGEPVQLMTMLKIYMVYYMKWSPGVCKYMQFSYQDNIRHKQTVPPERKMLVACCAPTTHGSPYSLATTAPAGGKCWTGWVLDRVSVGQGVCWTGWVLAGWVLDRVSVG